MNNNLLIWLMTCFAIVFSSYTQANDKKNQQCTMHHINKLIEDIRNKHGFEEKNLAKSDVRPYFDHVCELWIDCQNSKTEQTEVFPLSCDKRTYDTIEKQIAPSVCSTWNIEKRVIENEDPSTGKKTLTELAFVAGEKKPFTGIFEGYHRSGTKKAEIRFKNGKQNGLVCMWYDNGLPSNEAMFVDGKFEGVATEWNRDGTKHKERLFKNGKLLGTID